MAWSLSIGRFLGSELRVHVTFFLLLAWVAWIAWPNGGAPAALTNVIFVLAIFACVVAHEYGHALMARRFGIRTPDITLLPIGGMARLQRIPTRPGQELAVALAGPAVNVVIWAILALGLGAEALLSDLRGMADPDRAFLSRLATVNLILVLFNLIPAFPMDGGRVFRALLAYVMDRRRATWIAGRTGQALAIGFAGWSLYTGNPLLLLVAFFVFAAAGAEMRAAAGPWR